MRSPEEHYSPTSQTSSATYTLKQTDSLPLVPWRHMTRRQNVLEYRLDSARVLVWDELAHAVGRRHEGEVDGVDLSAAKDADHPAQAAFARGVAEGGAAAGAGIGKNGPEPDPDLTSRTSLDRAISPLLCASQAVSGTPIRAQSGIGIAPSLGGKLMRALSSNGRSWVTIDHASSKDRRSGYGV